MVIETTDGAYASLETLLNALLSGSKLYAPINLDGARGLIVTKDGKFTPANYVAKRPYFLSIVEQHAMFVPASYCQPRRPSVVCNVYAVEKDGAMSLLTNLISMLRHVERGGKVATDFPLSPNALGYVFSWRDNRCIGRILYSTTTSHYSNGNIYLNHNQVVKFNEENIMQDLSAILFGEELFAVSVNFKGSTKAYVYKSTKEYNQGDKVIVDSPHDGLVVVTVASCRRGLSTDVASFDSYKWLVGSVDMAEYNRLVEAERDFVRKAKQETQRREAIKKLAELGVTAEEYRKAILGD